MSRTYRHGVVVGKFLPFHRGHRLVVERALSCCERVSVLVGEKRGQEVPGDVRARWIRSACPRADVTVVDEDARGLPEDDSRAWAAEVRRLLGDGPDAVFTSEAYGPEFARLLGAAHVAVDPERREVPVSGTAIRAAPLEHLEFLDPVVRAHYVRRVCVTGAESTGKTTLAATLAERYGTLWVPEYGAVYHHVGRGDPNRPWDAAEFVHLARIRDWLEDFLAGYAARVLLCDTDTFVTAVFADVYLGAPVPEVEALGRARRYDLYVVCDPRTPFVQDELSLRREEERSRMHAAYVERIRESGTPYVEVAGDPEERLRTAAAAIDRLLGDA